MAADNTFSSKESEPFSSESIIQSSSSSNGSLFQRRIDFVSAKKQFSSFVSNGDFHLETLNPGSDSQRPVSSNSGQVVQMGKKLDGSEFLGRGLDPDLSFGITVRRIGAGLENLGNTCFLNSVLQCLTYTAPLAAYLQSGMHQINCRTAGFCALCAIQKHVSRALQSTGRILAPKDLVSNLRCISRNFRNARQEDAHEYMVNLLESMHRCCLPKGVPSESPGAYETSLVHKIFGGRLRSQVKCMQCSYCSNKFDPFLDLSLEILKADTLDKALRHFTATEQLDGGEKQYHCQRCKQKVRALKQLKVHKAPNVLAIHLKRFGSVFSGQKIDKKVHFEPVLDFKPFVSSNEGDFMYTLYGVLVHAGWSTHSGHYYCFVRTSSGMWYSLDDNRVIQVSEKAVLDQKAYMLFYFRDTKTFPPKKPHDARKENTFGHVLGNPRLSNPSQIPNEMVQNGSIEKTQYTPNPSVNARTQEDALKVASAPKVNGSAMEDTRVVKTESLIEPCPKVPLVTGKVSEVSEMVPKPEDVEKEPPKMSLVNGHVDTSSVIVSTSEAKTNGCSENMSANGDVSISAITPAICNDPQVSVEKLVVDKPSEKSNLSSKDFSNSILKEVDRERCPVEQISEIEEVIQTSEKCVPSGNAPRETVGDTGQNLVDLSSSSVLINGANPKESLAQKPRHKPKKKLLKRSCVASMNLGTKILFGASLNLRKKKKKHKRSKPRCALEINNIAQQCLSGEDCSTSTSKETRPVFIAIRDSRERKSAKSKSEKRDAKANGDSLKDNKNVDGEFRERIHKGGAELATDSISRKQHDISKSDKRRDSMQNGLMSMLTRGIEETMVARWDGTELPYSQILGSRGTQRTIGHVGDEWDEEYDMGKRKKVKISKNEFGGPNPFQEISTMKAQLKKPKMDQSSSGNRPFRI